MMTKIMTAALVVSLGLNAWIDGALDRKIEAEQMQMWGPR